MWHALWIITKKELRRVFTDRRLVLTSFVLPMVSIALIYSLMGLMIGRTQEDIESHESKIIGSHIPAGVLTLIEEDATMTLVLETDDYEWAQAKILEGEYEYYLVFPENYETMLTSFENGDLPMIEAYYSPKSDYSIESNYKMGALLEAYRQMILAERFGDASYLEVFNLDVQTVNIPDANKGIDRGIANIIPMLVSIFIFAGAMGIGMDSIAGEKERGTIASMLLTPVDRGVIIGGKILSLMCVALISMVSSFVGVLLSIPFSAKFLSVSGEFDLSQMAFGSGDFVLFFVSMIGLVGVYVTLISVLSMMANTVKEAGAYITPAYMGVMIAGFMTMFGSGDVSSTSYYIPIYNNIVNMHQVLLGNGKWGYALISLATSLILTLALVFLSRHLMHREKVMFPS
ncbi:ABC transporter permease [Fusibacter tunisiensis]|uniref:Sodium transport system permease protein n=1 Tax=Fusibacter tunisiensis TaxID=1008308 RepID=A0ABS2MQH1_9FIRM|nr:ABC transporter permease [Fusibacter tunisiensis]MBM7561644.1 sodium transport system permease protein [Fusibacter tunisiensis]